MMAGDGTLRKSISRDLVNLRDVIVERVYTGPIRGVSRRTGIDSLLRSIERNLGRRLPAPEIEIRVGGTSCTFHNDSIEEYRWFKSYHPESSGDMPVLSEIVENIDPSDDFWDVGGNLGIYSCLASSVVESGTVTVVEPHPKNVDRIRTNLDRNDLDGEVHQIALASEPGEVTLYLSSLDVAGAFGSSHYHHQGAELTVDAVPGDALRRREDVPSPDVMKIDVEGAECDALRGLEETLTESDCRLIYCDIYTEWNEDRPDEAVYDLLGEYGYEVERIWEWPDGNGHYVRAEKRPS